MNFHTLTFCIAAILASLYLTAADESVAQESRRPCLRTCNEHYRCNPYHVEPVWSIVDRRCRVFQNGCMFGNINCQRRNECLRPFVQTTQRDCQRACNFICPFGGSWVCATFYDRNSAGQSRERKMSFLNRCLLDLYSCQNGVAYSDVTEGQCP